MLLVVDMGNTNIVFAVFDGDDLSGQWRLATETKRTADEYAIVLKELMGFSDISFDFITNVIISSVVPQHVFEFKTFCKRYFSCDPLMVDNINVGIDIDIERPQDVGADRLVNAVAAYNIYKSPCIVIDFGTATTFDIIGERGNYIGGVIAPGINLSMKALHHAAAKLPEITIVKPENVVGKSTISAIQSGVYFGYTGLIEGLVSRIKNEYNNNMTTVATGGLSPLFAKATNAIEHLETDLTVYGLKLIFEKNR